MSKIKINLYELITKTPKYNKLARLEVIDNKLEILTFDDVHTNDSQFFKTTIEIEKVDGNNDVAIVELDKLIKLKKLISKNMCELEFEKEKLVIFDENNTLQLNLLEINYRDQEFNFDEVQSFDMEQKDLKSILNTVANNVYKKKDRLVFTYIGFALKDNEVVAVANDIHTLSVKKANISNLNFESNNYLVNTKVLKHVAKLKNISNVRFDHYLKNNKNFYRVYIENDSYIWTTETYYYPDIDRLIQKYSDYDTFVELDANDLLKKLSIIHSPKDKTAFIFEINNDVVVIKNYNSDNSYGDMEFNFKNYSNKNSKKMTVGFNPSYLKRAIENLGKGVDRVNIYFTSPVRPFTILNTDDKSNYQLISPIRICSK